MKTSYPLSFADLNMRSMFSRVLFSTTLVPTASQAAPCSLSTSFCGSMKTTAVSAFCTVIPDGWSVILRTPEEVYGAHCRVVSRLLAADEGEEVLADHIGVGSEQAVREARIDFQRTVLEELVRKQRSVPMRNDLIIVPLHDERGYLDALQILGEVRFGERLDAVIVGLGPAHHALPPPVRDHAFQRLGARPVEPVEGTGGEIAIKLGAVGGQAVAEAVEDFDRQAAWVARRLYHHRRYGRHQHRLGDPALAVSRNVT